jgi:predicted NBD/HSP70 family sugar kinase
MTQTNTRSLGVDVGGTSVKLALLEGGKTLWTGQSPFYAKPSGDELRAAIRAAAAGRDTAAAVTGICVPGLLSPDRSHVELSVNVPGLMGIPLVRLVHDSLGEQTGPVKVINDAMAATRDFADTYQLRGRVMAIALGTGVGAAILDDGVMLRVEGASSGHIGQVDVTLADAPVIGPDGGAGSLEGYLGVPALKQRYGENLNAVLPTLKRDSVALRALARAIRIAHAIYRPQHIGILGGIGVRLAPALGELEAAVRENLTSVAYPGWTIRCGNDDFHAARGAGKLALA